MPSARFERARVAADELESPTLTNSLRSVSFALIRKDVLYIRTYVTTARLSVVNQNFGSIYTYMSFAGSSGSSQPTTPTSRMPPPLTLLTFVSIPAATPPGADTTTTIPTHLIRLRHSDSTTTTTTPTTAWLSTFGATLVSFTLTNGQEVTFGNDLSRPSATAAADSWRGRTVGRLANRVKPYDLGSGLTTLLLNDNDAHHLHGGAEGFSHRVWELLPPPAHGDESTATLRLVSPHLDQGHPGALVITATFSIPRANTLAVHYKATLLPDSPVPHAAINMTFHPYWRLSPTAKSTSYLLHLPHSRSAFKDWYATEPDAVPPGSPLDFYSSKQGKPVSGNVDTAFPTQPGGVIAEVSTPALRMVVSSTTATAVVIYSATHLDFAGLCVEPSHAPALFRVLTRERPTYEHDMVHEFFIASQAG